MEKEYFKAEKNYQDNKNTSLEPDFPEENQVSSSAIPANRDSEELAKIRENIASEIKKRKQEQGLHLKKIMPDIKFPKQIKTIFRPHFFDSWLHKKDNHTITNDPATAHDHYYDDEDD